MIPNLFDSGEPSMVGTYQEGFLCTDEDAFNFNYSSAKKDNEQGKYFKKPDQRNGSGTGST